MVRRRIVFNCTGAALRRHLAGEAEQVLHDLLGALRLLQNHAHVFTGGLGQVGILHQQIGEAQNRGQRIVHFVSDAGNQLADRRHFFGVHQFVAQHGGIGNVGEHDHDAGHGSLLVAHGAEIRRELPDSAVAAHDLQFQIVDLLAVQRALQRIGQRADKARRGQFQQRTPQQFALFESRVVPAAVGVADQACGVGDQNQALRVAENLAGEIALAVQFRLVGAQAGHIEHQSANLQQAAQIVVACRRR